MARYDARARYLEAALELLADGRWQNYEQVVHQLVLMVPPGEGKRMAERSRISAVRYGARKRGEDGTSVPPRAYAVPDDVLWRIGARRIVKQCLARTQFEVSSDRAGRKRVRLSPVGRNALRDLRT